MKDLKRQLNEMHAHLEPEQAFADRLWSTLEDGYPSRAFRRSLWSQLASAFSFGWLRPLPMGAAALSLVMLLTGAGSAYAYASPTVEPDTTLYQVRTSIEQFEGRFHRSPEARATFEARMAERRASELERFPMHDALLRARMEQRLERGYVELNALEDLPVHRERVEERLRRLDVQYRGMVADEPLPEGLREERLIDEASHLLAPEQLEAAPERLPMRILDDSRDSLHR